MRFTKMQGAGNDFILIETADIHQDWSKLAAEMSDRHYGVGADGLLVLGPSGKSDFSMRIINADGSESDVCGNGLRCMVRYYIDTTTKPVDREIIVETRAGIRRSRISKTGIIQTSMGKPGFGEEDIPVREGTSVVDINNLLSCELAVGLQEVKVNLVSMGNPHAVLFIDSPVAEYPLSDMGPEITTHEVFPEGINFEVARVLENNKIESRVWERGVGETLACGSGACATGVAAHLKEFTGVKTDIVLPGGTLNVQWDGKGEVYLSGPAETVFTGEWPD